MKLKNLHSAVADFSNAWSPGKYFLQGTPAPNYSTQGFNHLNGRTIKRILMPPAREISGPAADSNVLRYFLLTLKTRSGRILLQDHPLSVFYYDMPRAIGSGIPHKSRVLRLRNVDFSKSYIILTADPGGSPQPLVFNFEIYPNRRDVEKEVEEEIENLT